MLKCEGLVLRQGAFELRADLSVPENSVTAIIGPSGAGKSTFLAAIAGFLNPEDGQLSWKGQRFDTIPPGQRPVSVLFQDHNLFPHLTVAQNVGLAIRPNLRMRHGDMAKIEKALSQVSLSGFGGRRPASLSGGQQSRVALARVLLADRPLVLLDEPFAALGPALKNEMLDLLKQVLVTEGGKTVLMVTHDPKDAKRIAEYSVVVAEGVVATPRQTEELFANPSAAIRSYLG